MSIAELATNKRNALRAALGNRAGRLQAAQYDALIAAQYDTPEALRDASEGNLKEVLKPALGAVDAVLAWQRENQREARLQLVLDRLEAVTNQLCQVYQAALETSSQTRSASKISALDLQRFREAASVEVIDTAAAMSFQDLLRKVPEADGFAWDAREEALQVDRYKPFWIEQLAETAARLQRPWPEGMLPTHWWDVCRMESLPFHHRRCDFPLSSKNSVVLCFAALNSDAILGVQMKKQLDEQALREAEVEFYTWDSWVPGPFLQVVTDLCRGGAAFWCQGVKDPASACISNSTIIRRQALTSMREVYEFVTNAVHSLPDHVVKAHRWPAGERVLAEPRRVKFFKPTMIMPPEELEEERQSSEGGPTDGRSSDGAHARRHAALSPERSRLLLRFLAKLRADADDVANLRDVADVA